MKKKGFWAVFDMFFDTPPAFHVLLVLNSIFLMVAIELGWPTMYTEKPREHQLNFERHNDRLLDESVRPESVTKYGLKTFRAKTKTNVSVRNYSVNVRIETDGTGRYGEIAEDILRLAPGFLGNGDVVWSRAPDIGDKGTPNNPPSGWTTRQLPYILEFDHGSDDGGVTVFFANGIPYPAKSTPWHSNDLYNFH